MSKITERNLWAEWWIHLIGNFDETMKTYLLNVERGSTKSLGDFLESIRIDWFEEMKDD